jgi:alpha,alpha-trehalose phosphorylase
VSAGPAPIYPPDPWAIRETSFDPAQLRRNETIFSLGNGHLGMRGNFEEGFPGGVVGTYINGFYEETPITYGEIAYGYAKNRQVMLNVADGKAITLSVGGERFDLSSGTILSSERTLDLARGVLHRRVAWRSPAGREVEIRVRRLVSLSRRHAAVIDWSVSLLRGSCPIEVESAIDGSVGNQAAADDPRIGTRFAERPLRTMQSEAEGARGILVQKTRTTGFVLACAMDHVVESGALEQGPAVACSTSPDRASVTVQAQAREGSTLRLVKYLAYCTSREFPGESCARRAREEVTRTRQAGIETLLEEQAQTLSLFWHAADVQIEGDDSLQQGVRFNLFSLFQSAGRDGRTSIAAKGLTGEGYEGHYFWDTEIYVLPFFTYSNPQIARALVAYRLGILGKARARAAEMSQRGALFPWRTIGGEETSPYYPAGTAQYHINADIVHAFRTYILATGDRTLLSEGGAEMLFETARLWADLGTRIPRRNGAFCINEVTGPDEYSALVNNNAYTNLMARENLEYAAATAEEMRRDNPAELERISAAIGLSGAEIEEWRRAAETMYLPFDRELGIWLQDDGFLDRAPWDFAGTPPESYPLLLHYHPLVIYRHQVLKQPDVVLAQVLLGHRFSMAEKKRNYDFYNPLTTGDSSLSPCIQCVAAAELGYIDAAYEYFSRTARMDLDDVNGNAGDGIHTAAMAGTWVSLVQGFAGMRDIGGRLSFKPRLPGSWICLRFRLQFRDRLLQVTIRRQTVTCDLLEGDPLDISIRGKDLRPAPGRPITESLLPTLECVIFDLDGVITDTAEMHFQAWSRLASEIGLPFDRTVNEELRGVGRGKSLEIILRNAGRTLPEEEKRKLAERKNSSYLELIRSITPSDLLPGVEGLLRRLREKGIRIALASASRNAPQIVERLGIGGMLDHVVDASTIVRGKPDPEVFLRAAESLGIPFENCAGVEDAKAGIQAIKAAGMFAAGIGRDLPGADWLVASTDKLAFDELVTRYGTWSRAWIG